LLLFYRIRSSFSELSIRRPGYWSLFFSATSVRYPDDFAGLLQCGCVIQVLGSVNLKRQFKLNLSSIQIQLKNSLTRRP